MYFLEELNTSRTPFFPHVINEWNELDPNICTSSNYHIFPNVLLEIMRPVERKTFKINNPFGIKMLTRLRLGFIHLLEHKFRHGFKDTLNPLCFCRSEVGTTTHYFHNSNRATLMNDLENIPISFSTLMTTI